MNEKILRDNSQKTSKTLANEGFSDKSGGKGGIRTHGTVSGYTRFPVVQVELY